MKTPSNRVAYFFVIATLLVVGTISYNAYVNKIPYTKNTSNIPEKNLAIVIDNERTNGDSDNDGLMDWEESLWNTDPNSQDTDMDGTKDGAEIALSRDPNKKGPGDAWSPNNFLDDYQILTSLNPNALTSKVAQNLFMGIGKKDSELVAEDLLKQIQEEIQIADIYKKENIIVFDENDKEKLQIYADSFFNIQLDEGKKIAAIANESERDYVAAYKKIALSLSTIPVPKNLVNLHANFINNINKMAVFTSAIQKADQDPVKMLAVVPEFTKISAEQKVLIEQIRAYLANNDIILNVNE